MLTRMKLVILFVALCWYLGPAPIAPAAPPAGPIIASDGRVYGVVRLESWDGEATNLGGEHFALSVDGLRPDLLVHFGGHGLFGDGVTLPYGFMPGQPWEHRYFVAELALSPTAGRHAVLDTPFSGDAGHLVPADDLAAARAMLAAIPTRGYPSGELALCDESSHRCSAASASAFLWPGSTSSAAAM